MTRHTATVLLSPLPAAAPLLLVLPGSPLPPALPPFWKKPGGTSATRRPSSPAAVSKPKIFHCR